MPSRLANLAAMLRAERRDRGRLEEAQAARLRRLVEHAFARVPGYRDLWRRHGVNPRDVRGVEHLRYLPVIDKRHIRETGVEHFLDRRYPGGRGLLARHTSGSSGTPFEFFVSRKHNKWRKAQRLRPYVSNGLRPWHRVLAVTSTEQRPRLLTDAIGMFAEHRVSAARPPGELVDALMRVRPDAITGYPSALGLLADACLQRGAAYARPALVFTDSEILTPGIRARLRAAFGAEPIDVYGSFETDNIAFQCALRKGLHVAMESAIVEVVHDGYPAEAEREGEVVVTVLRNYAMPLIRYNLHDLSAYAGSACACGRTLAALTRVHGRQDDYIRLPGGARRPAMPFLLEFDALAEWIREYRIVQAAYDEFEVYLHPAAELAAAASRVEAVFRRHLPGARLSLIECRGGIPREASGKLRCFVSEIAE